MTSPDLPYLYTALIFRLIHPICDMAPATTTTHDEAVQSNIQPTKPLQRDAYIDCTLSKDDAVDRSTATSLRSWADRSTSVSHAKDSPILSIKKSNVDCGITTEKILQNNATTSVDIQADDKSVNTSIQEDVSQPNQNEKVSKSDFSINTAKISSNDATTSISFDEKEDKGCCTSIKENIEKATGTRSFEFDTIVNEGKKKVEKVDFCGETDAKNWADVSIDAGIESYDKSACTSIRENHETGVGTERVEVNNRSMETSEIYYWRGESSRCVQTMFPEDLDEAGHTIDADTRRKLFSKANQGYSFEEHLSNHDASMQYSLSELDVCETGVQTLLSTNDLKAMEENAARSKSAAAMIKITKNDSTTSLDGSDEMLFSKKDAVTKQDLIIQTDDSYLKIARRLDEYRTNRSQGISVYTVGQTSPSHRRKNSRFLSTGSGFARRRSSRSPRVPRFPRNAATTPVDEEMTTRPGLLEPSDIVASTSTGVGRSDDDISEYSEVSESEYKATKSSYSYSEHKSSISATSNLLSVAQSAKKSSEKSKRNVSWRPKLLSRASTSSLFGNEEKKSVKPDK
ncbi:unnamed protein product [Bursaphelenchus xylophilus]|uniref:(pine wood nematode) hypothetical protein n=1 Tax=Bursaphelenchus xylophilus TaxID=6326 RepID=A0A1I7RZB1_BURXY|nr:unnamed protein product [Bursaphelenchus xylophilus]CAG9106659.1 unnamed protein product [Bursaphelenchus xylophilus]